MKKYFNSNEKLEYCTVDVTENGQITIATQPYHAPELERLGCPPNPTHSIRGRVTMSYDRKEFIFAPYAEGARKPTYQKQVVVGSTTLAVTEDKVKISFMVPRHLEKRLMLLYVQSEIDEVKRRLDTDVYDSLVKGTHQQETQQQETHPNPPCEGGDSESIAEEEGGDA
jgi:hypothetical protein